MSTLGRRAHANLSSLSNYQKDLGDYFSKFSERDGEWLRDWVWLIFTYYKEGDITSIYDCSVVGSTNKYV